MLARSRSSAGQQFSPALSLSDLELAVLPVDPKLRALVRALDAGPSEEVIALKERKMLTPKRNPSGKLRARCRYGSDGVLSALERHSASEQNDSFKQMPAFNRPPQQRHVRRCGDVAVATALQRSSRPKTRIG